MPDHPPSTMGLREFARYKNWRASYVSELKTAGRLVLTADGTRIKVAESIARIAATSDPSKAAVAARHAAARPAPQADDDSDDDNAHPHHATPALDDDARAGSLYQRARAEREKWQALKARREYEQLAGHLVPVDQATATAADIAATVRSRLENLPHVLAGNVHDDDRDRVFTTTTDIVEALLTDMANTFRQRLATTPAAPATGDTPE